METDPEDVPLPRGVALAWGVAAHPQRGPKRELSLERIVESAIELADAEGLGAVSMAAVAGRLGFTTMALYRYVTNKDELLMVMADAALGVPPLSIREGETWRERVTAYHRETLAVYEAHPWLLDVPIEGVPATPASLGWLEEGLAALEGTPLDWHEKTAVMLLVQGVARWTATIERGYRSRAASDGVSPDEIDRVTEHVLDTLVTAEGYPHVRQALDHGILTADADPFSFGLDRVLDGVALYVERRAEHAEPAPAATGEEAPAATDAYPRDPKVRAVSAERREAERALREAERRLRETVKREREAVARAREREGRDSARP